MYNLVATCMDPIVQIDCEGTIRLANPACCKCFQYEESELIGKNITMLMPEPYATQHGNFIKNYLRTGNAKVMNKDSKSGGRKLPALRRDGTTFPMFLTLTEAVVEGEKVFTGIMRNLSAEEEEKQTLLAMHGLLESSIDPIVQISYDGTIRLANPACCKCFQYSDSELVGMNICMLMPEPYSSKHAQFIENYLRSGIPKVVEEGRKGRKLPGLRRDGTTFPMFLTLSESVINGTKVFTGIMRNLSAEEEEKQTLLAMHGLVKSSIDPIVQINDMGIIRLANPACCKCFQYEESELIGKNINTLMPEPYATKHDQFIANYLKTGIPKVVERGRKGRKLPGMRRDGTTFPMFLTLSESLVNGEKVFTGIMRNLSAEEEERQILAAMIDSCIDPIVVITTQGEIERCNPACTNVFGYTKDELIGGNITMLMPEPHATIHQQYIDKYLNSHKRARSNSEGSESKIVGKGRDVSGKRKDGSEFPVFLSVSEFQINSFRKERHGFIGIMRDMSEKERAIAAEVEKGKSEALLMNVLPHHICERMKECTDDHEHMQIADAFDNVTILFADIVGFTKFASHRSPMEVVHYLNRVFRNFDVLVGKYNLEKIKTIGDAYMAVSGLDNKTGNVYKMIKFSLEMLDVVEKLNNGIHEDGKHTFGVRIGLHTGSVVAGVVGTKRRFFDLWGDAVNIASRMESTGVENCVHCTKSVAEVAMKHSSEFLVVPRGNIDIKGKGQMETFIISTAENQKAITNILKMHSAARRRESYLIHQKLGKEFNFDSSEIAENSIFSKYSALACSFLAGGITAALILKSSKR